MNSHDYTPILSPKEFSKKVTEIGFKKANAPVWQLFCLAVLAGIYISFGGQVFLVALQQDLGKIVAGAVFGFGLVMVVLAGSELFTGNIIMTIGVVNSTFSYKKLLRNWTVVYIGNFIGSIFFAALVWKTGLFGTIESVNELGILATNIAEKKLSLSFEQCFIRGFFCNILVVLAIILATFAKDVISKIICCILPILIFVSCGFEHCIANMFLIPIGLLAKGTTLAEFPIIFRNIIPVTFGNIIGGIFIIFMYPSRLQQLFSKFKHKKKEK